VIVSGHQVTFLPNSRFWHKLAKSDLMDLRYRAQYTEKPGYERRVMMRDKWCPLALEGKPRYEPMNEVRINGPESFARCRDTIQGRYGDAPHFKTRGVDLLDRMETLQNVPYLWQWNLELLLHVRDVIGITTPFALGVDNTGTRAEGVVSWIQGAHPYADTYLSGIGAKKYMADTTVFDEAGIKVVWSNHKAVTNDSILTVLMDYDNPVELVMLEETRAQ
jgi:hypothetical protein